MKTLQSILFTTYFCLVMIVLGGTIFSVLVEYPNWFASVPQSLESTRTFYKVLHPGYFFQIFGPLMLLTGIAFVVASRGVASVRNLMLVSIALFVSIELLTFFYIYPRLNILFGPDSPSQAIDVLSLAARQFTTADRIRTAGMFIASGFAVAALFRFFKHRYEPEPR